MKQNDGCIPAGALLHLTLTRCWPDWQQPWYSLLRERCPSHGTASSWGTQGLLASAPNMVRALLNHRHNLGMTRKLRHFMRK